MQQRNTQTRAFTLVELIVVITILSILGTIGFISMQGYTVRARESVRVSDLATIQKSLEFFQAEEGFLPDPTDFISITYSGALAWKQGTFGDETRNVVQRISEVPKDPLTGNPYAYSVTNRRTEYELGAIQELQFSQNNFSNSTVFADNLFFSNVVGNYNKKIVRVNDSSTMYLLGVPTLITSEINDVEVQQISSNQTYSIKGGKNLAASYNDSLPEGQTLTGAINFVPGTIGGDEVLLYSGSFDSLGVPQNRYNLGRMLIEYYKNSNVNQSEFASYSEFDGMRIANSLVIGNVVGLQGEYIEATANSCPVIEKVESNVNGYAVLLTDGTLVSPSLTSDSTLHLEFGVQDIIKSRQAFALLKNDGTVETFGNPAFGGDSSTVQSELNDIIQIVATNDSFAALKNNGTVVLWGSTDSSSVAAQLVDIEMLYKDSGNFFARKSNGEFVIWGKKNQTKPADISVFNAAIGTKVIKEFATATFANTILFEDGTVYSWGQAGSGGNNTPVNSELYDIVDIIAGWYAFAALRADGRVFAWSTQTLLGGDTSSVDSLLNNVEEVLGNGYSFLALKNDGSVVTWGRADTGGAVPIALSSELVNIESVYHNSWAFSALRNDGRVFSWGDPARGGNNSSLGSFTASKVFGVNSDAMASISSDGGVNVWGGGTNYQNTSTILDEVNISEIYGNWNQNFYIGYSELENNFYQWGNIPYEGIANSIGDIMLCN